MNYRIYNMSVIKLRRKDNRKTECYGGRSDSERNLRYYQN